jgi:Ni,Fe-hydrogenase III large subunit
MPYAPSRSNSNEPTNHLMMSVTTSMRIVSNGIMDAHDFGRMRKKGVLLRGSGTNTKFPSGWLGFGL